MLAAPHALTGRRPSAVTLVLSNLVPLVGVAAFGWSLWEVMLLYWLENAVIGLYAVGRILSAAGGDDALASRLGTAAFFSVHYGGFWLGHGLFLMTTFGDGSADLDVVGAGLVAMVASHGVSFVANYLRREREWAVASIEMFKPYGRVVLLHVVILSGGWIVQGGGSPVWALALLVGLKTVLDLAVHLVGHAMREGAMPAVRASPDDREGWTRRRTSIRSGTSRSSPGPPAEPRVGGARPGTR